MQRINLNLKKKGKYTNWKIVSLLTVGLLTASIIIMTYFIYQNIYATLANSYSIIVLSNDLELENLDTKDYYDIKGVISLKQEKINMDNTRNMFEYFVPATTTLILEEEN